MRACWIHVHECCIVCDSYARGHGAVNADCTELVEEKLQLGGSVGMDMSKRVENRLMTVGLICIEVRVVGLAGYPRQRGVGLDKV